VRGEPSERVRDRRRLYADVGGDVASGGGGAQRALSVWLRVERQVLEDHPGHGAEAVADLAARRRHPERRHRCSTESVMSAAVAAGSGRSAPVMS
jgi:hypothetical protein